MADDGQRMDEAKYLRGAQEPALSSVLISSSKYLNDPLFRDLYAQMGLKRDGRDLPPAYLVPDLQRAFDEVTDWGRVAELVEQEKRRLPEFAAWLEARFLSNLTAENTRDYPAGTLGARVHAFIADSGMQIDFMFLGEAKTDLEYLNKRRVQVHDIEHMVTGLDPSPVGETGLIVAHTIANCRYFSEELAAELNRFGLFLVSTGLMRKGLHYPSVVPAYIEAIARGRALGERQARPLFMIRWEDHLHKPIAQIRAEFGFQDGPPEGSWDWTYEAARG
jgi:ubiquinone biosynthesis protein Coq4